MYAHNAHSATQYRDTTQHDTTQRNETQRNAPNEYNIFQRGCGEHVADFSLPLTPPKTW